MSAISSKARISCSIVIFPVTECTALWIEAPYSATLRSTKLAEPKKNELCIRARCSAISRGTEKLVYQGRIPESEYGRMRCPFQKGDFPFPVQYGYSMVGEVVSGDESWLGASIFTLHPHQDLFCIPVSAAHRIPSALPLQRAVLAANMETALNVLWDASPHIGERITVIGAGVLGCLIASLAATIPGTEVDLIDIRPDRAVLAQRLGCTFHQPDAALGNSELILHASGTESGLKLALELAAFEGRVIEVSWFGDTSITLPLGKAFHSRRLQLISSQVGQVSSTMRGRRNHTQRMALALSLLNDPRLDVLLEPGIPFAEAPQALKYACDPENKLLCQIIEY